MKKQTKLFLAILIVAFAAVLGWLALWQGPAPAPVGRPPLRLAVDIWPGNFWGIIAEEKGYFAEEGLSVELLDVSADYDSSLDDLVRGELDANVLALFDLARFSYEGTPLVGILVTDMSLEGEGIVAKPGITRLSDLRGKRIGVHFGSYLDFSLDWAMANAGLSAGDCTKVDIPTDDLPAEFGAKNLDAAIAWQPTLGELEEKYGLEQIFSASEIEGLSPGVLVIPRHLAESRPDDISRMLRAWEKATEFIQSSPREALSLVGQFNFLSSPGKPYGMEELESMVKADKINDLNDNLNAFSFSMGADSLYGNLQSIARYMRRHKNMDPAFDVNRLLEPRFIRLLK